MDEKSSSGSVYRRIGSTVGMIVSSLPDFGFAAVFLVTWISPYTFGEKMVSYLLLIMLMEFINVHSSGFTGFVAISDMARKTKAMAILGLSLFYFLFVGALALGFQSWWPVWAFAIMTGNRLLGLVLGQAPNGKEKAFVMYSWAVCVFWYLIGVGFTVMVPMPELGITRDVVLAQEFESGGVWIDEPQTVVAFGFVYFTAVGISELVGYSWLARKETVE
jgi:hypothetical protein